MLDVALDWALYLLASVVVIGSLVWLAIHLARVLRRELRGDAPLVDPLRHRHLKDGRVVWADGKERKAWRT